MPWSLPRNLILWEWAPPKKNFLYVASATTPKTRVEVKTKTLRLDFSKRLNGLVKEWIFLRQSNPETNQWVSPKITLLIKTLSQGIDHVNICMNSRTNGQHKFVALSYVYVISTINPQKWRLSKFFFRKVCLHGETVCSTRE